jgi:hypothetical protein
VTRLVELTNLIGFVVENWGAGGKVTRDVAAFKFFHKEQRISRPLGYSIDCIWIVYSLSRSCKANFSTSVQIPAPVTTSLSPDVAPAVANMQIQRNYKRPGLILGDHVTLRSPSRSRPSSISLSFVQLNPSICL